MLPRCPRRKRAIRSRTAGSSQRTCRDKGKEGEMEEKWQKLERGVNPAFTSNSHTDRSLPQPHTALKLQRSFISSLKPRQLLFCFLPFRACTRISLCDVTWWIYEFNHRRMRWAKGLAKKCSDVSHKCWKERRRAQRPALQKGYMVWIKKYSACWEKQDWYRNVTVYLWGFCWVFWKQALLKIAYTDLYWL